MPDSLEGACNRLSDRFTARLEREIASTRKIIETRLDGMDRAVVIFQENLTRVPTDTDKQISHLKQLHDEKFTSIQTQFSERDQRARASEDAAKVAVNAALQAQKEAAASQNDSNAAAITKSEATTVKQIDGILALLASNANALSDKIATINGRLDRGEGVDTGKDGSQATLIAIAAIVVSLLLGGLALFNQRVAHDVVVQEPPALATSR